MKYTEILEMLIGQKYLKYSKKKNGGKLETKEKTMRRVLIQEKFSLFEENFSIAV